MSGNLPTPVKTWMYATLANSLLGNDVLNQFDMMLKVHAQRKAWGHVIKGSGNGASGAMDGVDRWHSSADFPSFTNGVWMVYENAAGAQDRVQYHNSGESDWGFYHSADGGYTGGSSSAQPTAAHENSLYGNSWFGRGDGGSNPQFVCHLWCSTDLTCFRQSYWFGGNNFGNLFYDAVDGPSTGWAAPNYAIVNSYGFGISGADPRQCGYIGDFVFQDHGTGGGTILGWGPHGKLQMLGTVEGTGPGGYSYMPGLATVAKNKISGTYRLGESRSGIYEPIGNADGGWHGRLFDFWWAQSSSHSGPARIFAPGSTIQLDGSRQFVIVGDWMFPWNGTSFRIT